LGCGFRSFNDKNPQKRARILDKARVHSGPKIPQVMRLSWPHNLLTFPYLILTGAILLGIFTGYLFPRFLLLLVVIGVPASTTLNLFSPGKGAIVRWSLPPVKGVLGCLLVLLETVRSILWALTLLARIILILGAGAGFVIVGLRFSVRIIPLLLVEGALGLLHGTLIWILSGVKTR
jgi:hypothetical protein